MTLDEILDAKSRDFKPGETFVNYSVPIYDGREKDNLVAVAASTHLASGEWTQRFEGTMVKFFGARAAVLVNSGSSANLLMVASLMSKNLPGHLRRGDRVLMPALGFPTTLAPVVQMGLVPVYLDVELETYNPTFKNVAWAAQEHHVSAIFLPHPIGLPFDARDVAEYCKSQSRWLIEDGCDSLGGTVDDKLVGTFGSMSSLSCFPAHHITAGEAGIVIVNDPKLTVIARSIANWGKSCYCAPGDSNTCGKRFEWDFEGMPFGFDHKYCFSEIGMNLKATDMQAAVLCAQAEKIEWIVRRRRENFWRLLHLCEDDKAISQAFVLPRVTGAANPSPYAFPLMCRDGVDRRKVVASLEAAKIETRPIFGGNLTRQPAFRDMRSYVHRNDLKNTDAIMERGFFVGVHPFLSFKVMDYIAECLKRTVN